MGKNIGIKYCGQCNSLIRMSYVYNALKELDKDNYYDDYYYDDKDFDYVIVLCGCTADCIDVQREFPSYLFHPNRLETADEMAKRIYDELKDK